jgi:serine/threonine-protein kinase
MDPERWQQIDQLFHSALKCEPAARAAFLERACAGDEALRREVESLIGSHEQPDSFIESPAADLAAELLAGSDAALPPDRLWVRTRLSPSSEREAWEKFMSRRIPA